jgi:hypothetical protein
MFDGSSYVVPPRPTYAGPCTCVWPAEYARQQERAKIEQDSSAKADVITSPIGVISSALPERMVPGAFQGVHHRMQAAADNADKKVKHEQLDEFGRSPQLSGAHSVSHSPPLGSSNHPAMLSTDSTIAPPDTGYPQRGPGYGEFSEGDSEFGSSSKVPRPAHIQHYNPEREDPKVADNRARTKAQAKGKLATKAKPDPLGRAGKKWFAKSSESPDLCLNKVCAHRDLDRRNQNAGIDRLSGRCRRRAQESHPGLDEPDRKPSHCQSRKQLVVPELHGHLDTLHVLLADEI